MEVAVAIAADPSILHWGCFLALTSLLWAPFSVLIFQCLEPRTSCVLDVSDHTAHTATEPRPSSSLLFIISFLILREDPTMEPAVIYNLIERHGRLCLILFFILLSRRTRRSIFLSLWLKTPVCGAWGAVYVRRNTAVREASRRDHN